MSVVPAAKQKIKTIALLGNPNCGKTTLFNALTGLRQTTANYPGVTVEKKEGRMLVPGSSESVTLLDLPGTYSLLPCSPDERVVHDVLFGIQKGSSRPDGLIIVLDASNLERNLYLVSQLLEVGVPAVLVLNMSDTAKKNGVSIDMKAIEQATGCPVIATAASRGDGIPELKKAIASMNDSSENLAPKTDLSPVLPELLTLELAKISEILGRMISVTGTVLRGEALRLLADIDFRSTFFQDHSHGNSLKECVAQARTALAIHQIDWSSVESESRYEAIGRFAEKAVKVSFLKRLTHSELIDLVLTHKIWGLLSFIAIMGLIFQSIFTWAEIPMNWITNAVTALGMLTSSLIPSGMFQSLVVDGIIAGVGNVVVFLPQIFLLFFFIAILEDIGYMARAAFVLDRLMKKVGLNGKAFLPLLSSFACAIPGIMATRTIEDRNDRMATILVAPLMSCSARLPVYTLLIGAFIPAAPVFGFLNMKGITLFAMYALSIGAGLGMAALFRKTLLRGVKSPFVFELPPYRLPDMKTVFITTWLRAREFLVNAGTIIFFLSIVLWFLVSFPKDSAIEHRYQEMRAQAQTQFSSDVLELRLTELNAAQSGEELRSSFAGRLGHFIEPAIKPLGFDWKIGIGLIGSFAAREVLVSTLAIVYNVGKDQNEKSVDLIHSLQAEKKDNGEVLYTPLTAVTLMVFFVLACQCMSTVAIVKRETNSWRWPAFMVLYMTALAWGGSFLVYHGGRALGFS